jgi:hypothetical protein
MLNQPHYFLEYIHSKLKYYLYAFYCDINVYGLLDKGNIVTNSF